MPSFNPKLIDHELGKDILGLFSFLDSYLLEDLKSMNNLSARKKRGKCHYPMILTIITGMDLLGTFSNGKRSKGPECLKKFIVNYMDPKYHKVIDIFYELIRNGSAHYYLMKKGIAIERGKKYRHLSKDTEWFYIEIDILYKDFLIAYQEAKNDIEDHIVTDTHEYISGYKSLIKNIVAEEKHKNGIMDAIPDYKSNGYKKLLSSSSTPSIIASAGASTTVANLNNTITTGDFLNE